MSDEPKLLTLRVSLAGVCLNAADELERLAATIREDAGWTDDNESDDPAGNPEPTAWMLREIARMARETAEGKHTIEDFADYFCLKGE